MAKLQKVPTLSIIIPTLNAASFLPLLLADLNAWPYRKDIILVDGGSTDLTVSIAQINKIKVIKIPEANRGLQLNIGASNAKGDWLLFLHADSRLDQRWVKSLSNIIRNLSSQHFAWYFEFKIKRQKLQLRILELAVALRSQLFQRPYGDQGLLIHRNLYHLSGGYLPLKIMEDIDFITRITKTTKLRNIGENIYTDGSKWDDSNVIRRAIKSAILRRKWKQGYDINKLYKEYYS